MSLVVGLVVHPQRDIGEPVQALRDWADRTGAGMFQVDVEDRQQDVAPTKPVEECDLVLAIGGDGTALAAIRVAASRGLPVLGVACGSLGVLTSVVAADLAGALQRFADGDWQAQRLPALRAEREGGEDMLAFNDLAVVRAGSGQVRTRAAVDGALFARLAGDGCVVSTAVGSSAYALAAGGPLLEPEAPAFLFTPLPSHAGFVPPLVIGERSRLELEIIGGHAGARVELDGQLTDDRCGSLRITLAPEMAIVVGFEDQEPFLEGLRRRGVITDSPRIIAEDGYGPESPC